MMRHYLTYQDNVQRFFREHSEKYHGVIIPMSIATSFPSGTYGFVRALCSRHNYIEYSIDPRNALFQDQWNRSNVRPPHEKMASELGEPYTTKALSQALEPADFDDDSVLRENVKLCIDFQKQFRMRSEDKRKLDKYQKLLGLKSLDPLKQPQHLIPPYYQFSSFTDPWYNVSMNSTQAALPHRDGIPLRPVLHFNQWAGIGDWASCFSKLTESGINELWYYPNNFKEHNASAEELTAYRDAVANAVSKELLPFCLFGGYFAALMSHFGLAGFGNGIGYGEWRDSGYHRGGTASIRIYLQKLHRYIDAPAAQNLIDNDPDYFGRDSEILSGYVDSRRSVVDMSQQETLHHFMECRKQELEFVESHSISEAISELNTTISKLKKIGPLEHEKYGDSLGRWRDAISH